MTAQLRQHEEEHDPVREKLTLLSASMTVMKTTGIGLGYRTLSVTTILRRLLISVWPRYREQKGTVLRGFDIVR